MGDEELGRYLTDSYRRDILGESVEVRVPAADPQLIENIKAKLAWIASLRLGANLAQRDFVVYQHKQALEKLLKQLEAQPGADDAAEP